MRKTAIVLAVAALGACSRTESGDVEIKRPASVEVKTTTDTLRLPTVGTRIDTISTPVMGVKKETLIVNKPVVGTKKTEVKVPFVKRP